MYLTPEERSVGRENFFAAVGSKHVRRAKDQAASRDFLLKGIQKGIASRKGLGSYYFGYGEVKDPVRVGVIGTGDEGSVLIGAINPAYIEVRSIADIRPYSIYRAFHGEAGVSVRPGLLSVYGWKEEDAKKVKVYGPWEELIAHAKEDGLEAVIIALPLFLHAPVAIAAMKAGLHVLTEKLMGHSVHECKEMARAAQLTKRYLATGHQRHYSILYENAVELIRSGLLGDIHYIAAQWHRGNLPQKDSWKMPLPPGVKSLEEDPDADVLLRDLADLEAAQKKTQADLAKAKDDKKADLEKALKLLEVKIRLKKAQIDDQKVQAEKYRYQAAEWKYRDASGKEVAYRRPAIEELIRWRLWDRTGGGLMAELGSHQLDAASIFIAAMFGGQKQYPLSVSAAANRPIFPPDRDIEDHVYCVFEFPAPGYDPKDPHARNKKIGVQYSSINGNGFGGYGETVYGTAGTLVLERESEALLYKVAATTDKTKVSSKKVKKRVGDKEVEEIKLSLDLSDSGDEESLAVGQLAMLEAKRGYTEELEHWAWCIREASEAAKKSSKDYDAFYEKNQPRCHPKVALGDAVIALTANKAAREGTRIDFHKEWFDPDSDATPEGIKPDLGRYA
jgi:predicted dehydrogenase